MDTETSNLVKARSSIVWILAILVAFGLVWWIEKQSGRELIDKSGTGEGAAARAMVVTGSENGPAPAPAVVNYSPDLPPLPAPRPLIELEQAAARIAWAYFDTQADPQTGLVGSVQGYPAATLWDMGSHLLALVSAHDLGLLDARGLDERLARILATWQRLPLYGGVLPNKSYDIRSLAMTDYANRPSEQGIGWSAIDLGRALVALGVVTWRHPQHAAAVRAVLEKWDLSRSLRDAHLFGMHVEPDGKAHPVQEGRLGYEQYAARGFALVGLRADSALSWRRNLRWVEVEGIQLPVDLRDPHRAVAQNFIVSDPFLLGALELGWGMDGREMTWRVYRAQEERMRRTGVPTAVTEDHVDQEPYFLYNAVFNAGQPWVTVTETGKARPELRTLSVKAAFGWHALYGTEHTRRLVEEVAALHEPAKGFYAGRYEQDGRPNRAITANTNAVVLESLAFIARGPLLRFR